MRDDRLVRPLDFSGKRHIGVMLILLSAFLFSPVGVFSKGVDADAWSVLFWRSVFAAPAGFLYLVFTRNLGSEWYRFRCHLRFALPVIIMQTGATAAFIAAFKLTSVTNVSLIWGTSPVIASAIAWLWLRERVTSSFLVAVVLVIAGNSVLVLGSAGAHGGTSVVGDALALLMTILVVSAAMVYRYCPDMPSTMPPVLSSLALVAIAVMLIDPSTVPAGEIAISALSGISFVMACALLFEGSKYLAPGEVALLEISEIPLAIILAVLLLAEYPSIQTMIGGTIIMGAVIWYQWRTLAKDKA